jgi:hypothetical protein
MICFCCAFPTFRRAFGKAGQSLRFDNLQSFDTLLSRGAHSQLAEDPACYIVRSRIKLTPHYARSVAAYMIQFTSRPRNSALRTSKCCIFFILISTASQKQKLLDRMPFANETPLQPLQCTVQNGPLTSAVCPLTAATIPTPPKAASGIIQSPQPHRKHYYCFPPTIPPPFDGQKGSKLSVPHAAPAADAAALIFLVDVSGNGRDFRDSSGASSMWS